MDFITDQSGRHLLRLAHLAALPAYISDTPVDDSEIIKLAEHQFADPINREFPMDSAGHTYLSYAYLKSAGICNPQIEGLLKKAAVIWKIQDDLNALDTTFTKAASARDAQYAVHVDFGSGDPTSANVMIKAGGVKGFYPINDATEIEQSASQLVNDKYRIPLQSFVDGCRSIVKAAAVHQVDASRLPHLVFQYGEERYPDVDFLLAQADQRELQTGDDRYHEIIKSAAENVDGVDLLEYASLWYALDQQHGIRTKTAADAYTMFNSGELYSTVDAREEQWVNLAGADVPLEKIASISDETLSKFFPKVIADQLKVLVKNAHTGTAATAACGQLEMGTQRALLQVLLR